MNSLPSYKISHIYEGDDIRLKSVYLDASEPVPGHEEDGANEEQDVEAIEEVPVQDEDLVNKTVP